MLIELQLSSQCRERLAKEHGEQAEECIVLDFPIRQVAPQSLEVLFGRAHVLDGILRLSFSTPRAAEPGRASALESWQVPFVPETPEEWDALLLQYCEAYDAMLEGERAKQHDIMKRYAAG